MQIILRRAISSLGVTSAAVRVQYVLFGSNKLRRLFILLLLLSARIHTHALIPFNMHKNIIVYDNIIDLTHCCLGYR